MEEWSCIDPSARPPGPSWRRSCCCWRHWPAVPASARDWNRADDPLLDGVGLHAGKIGGVGLSFKFPLQWWLYGQATGGIWHTADNKQHNAGFEVQYLLRQDRALRLFVAGGIGYFYHQDRQTVFGGDDLVDTRHSWNTGFGVGVEMLRGERLSVQVEARFHPRGQRRLGDGVPAGRHLLLLLKAGWPGDRAVAGAASAAGSADVPPWEDRAWLPAVNMVCCPAPAPSIRSSCSAPG